MARYRKKPVVVEAFQYGIDSWPDWFQKKVDAEEIIPYSISCDIIRLEGVFRGGYGDYIIQGINGEVYPCEPEIFEQTYELVKQIDYSYLINTWIEIHRSDDEYNVGKQAKVIDVDGDALRVVVDENGEEFWTDIDSVYYEPLYVI